MQGLKSAGIILLNMGYYLGIDNLNPEVTTKAQIDERKMAYYLLNQFVRAHVTGFEEAVIVSTATELGVRTSRKISAKYNLKNSNDLRDKHFPDVIGVFCPQQTYLTEIPYRSLVPLKVDNLLVARA